MRLNVGAVTFCQDDLLLNYCDIFAELLSSDQEEPPGGNRRQNNTSPKIHLIQTSFKSFVLCCLFLTTVLARVISNHQYLLIHADHFIGHSNLSCQFSRDYITLPMFYFPFITIGSCIKHNPVIICDLITNHHLKSTGFTNRTSVRELHPEGPVRWQKLSQNIAGTTHGHTFVTRCDRELEHSSTMQIH